MHSDDWEDFGRRLGVQIQVLDVGRPDEFDSAFAAAVGELGITFPNEIMLQVTEVVE
jgi:hypothetical protein